MPINSITKQTLPIVNVQLLWILSFHCKSKCHICSRQELLSFLNIDPTCTYQHAILSMSWTSIPCKNHYQIKFHWSKNKFDVSLYHVGPQLVHEDKNLLLTYYIYHIQFYDKIHFFFTETQAVRTAVRILPDQLSSTDLDLYCFQTRGWWRP